jgi:DNA polymerase I-like protein with 3'-5' exonuclease and polymerase domains
MNNVCIVEKYPSNYNYSALFPFEFDKESLVKEKMDKVLKRNVTCDIEAIRANYEYVILVGKEAFKLVGGLSSIVKYQGYLLEDKYLGMMSPGAVTLRPSLKMPFEKAIKDITRTIAGEAAVVHKEYDVKGLQSESSILEYLDFLENGNFKNIAIDTETSAFYARDGWVLGICLSHKIEQGVYMDSMYVTEKVVERLQNMCNTHNMIFHNAKFDMHMLSYHFGLTFPNWDDSMLMHYALDETEGSHDLKQLALRFTDLGDYDKPLEDFKTSYRKQHGILVKDFTYDLIPFETMVPYACLDAAATLQLYLKFSAALAKSEGLTKVYTGLLKRGTSFLVKVEDNGIPVCETRLRQYIDEVSAEVAALTEQLYTYDEVKRVEKATGKLFNVNSPAHVGALLYDELGFTPFKFTDGGANSTDAEVLEKFAEENLVAKVINDIKKLKKINSTYLEKMLHGQDLDGHLRTGFNLHTTTSGRLSSSGKINAQQLPRDNKLPKKAIRAKEGFQIVSQDLGTAEMYITGVISGDKALQQIFKDGVDYHGAMAVQKFGLTCHPNDVASKYPQLRQEAKTISFEILYKLNLKEKALENFPTLLTWLEDRIEEIEANGYILSLFGRKRRVKDVFSPNKREAKHWVRSAINFLVQSVSSDINLLAGMDMQDWIEENGHTETMKIWGLVHDSILAEVREDVVDLYIEKLAYFTQLDRGCSIPGCPIKLDVAVGEDYAEAA